MSGRPLLSLFSGKVAAPQGTSYGARLAAVRRSAMAGAEIIPCSRHSNPASKLVQVKDSALGSKP